jgi:hypothetical protein
MTDKDGNVLAFQRRIPGHRTDEQIQADLEARYAEMEAEAERQRHDPSLLYPCVTCKWRKGSWCENPLVIGIKREDTLHRDCDIVAGLGGDHYKNTLCGPEKALWAPISPKPSLWQRFLAWLERLLA